MTKISVITAVYNGEKWFFAEIRTSI